MAPEPSIELITTEDGSHSLYIKELDETYHSVHGAIQESQHIFINYGLLYWLSENSTAKSVKILEFGFGTGLNALLTVIHLPKKVKIEYSTIEKYPLPREIYQQLNYGLLLAKNDLFLQIHSSAWEELMIIQNNFSLKKIAVDFRQFKSKERYDLIFFDAFAPDKQPELWDKPMLAHCYNLLCRSGVLVTYSAKGQLKRDLKAVGFSVECLPGPPGKFEITRAIK